MIHFNHTSKNQITIRVVDDFSHQDTERIAFLLEASYDTSSDKEIVFQVETDLPKEEMQLLGNFSQGLPFQFRIDLKYPVLEWQKP
ncbi:hypothetical protein [Cellulophaga sp. L1A9]|uniref:hypothetical protein n=1 Tax=Cellulophaga sp. L1A9 TaxID=2686362 RepID=UPI00131D8111|nr:hypothetical protein [Cellulophaga sp. L1A9]